VAKSENEKHFEGNKKKRQIDLGGSEEKERSAFEKGLSITFRKRGFVGRERGGKTERSPNRHEHMKGKKWGKMKSSLVQLAKVKKKTKWGVFEKWDCHRQTKE